MLISAPEINDSSLFPYEIWLQILEYYLFDLEGHDKVNFSFVCKRLNKVFYDEQWFKNILKHYLPFYLDHPNILDPKTREEIYRLLGFKLPNLMTPKQYIRSYLIAKMLRGYAFEDIISELENYLLKIYNPSENGDKLKFALYAGFKEAFSEIKLLKDKVFSLQHGACAAHIRAHLDPMEQLEAYINNGNFRQIIAFIENLYSASYLSFEGHLRWLAFAGELDAMQKLLTKKKSEQDFPPDSDLSKVSIALNTLDLTATRKVLNVFYIPVRAINLLNTENVLSILRHFKYDDLFVNMKPAVFRALVTLGGAGTAFQLYLLERLARANRSDLFEHIEINAWSVFPCVEKTAILANLLTQVMTPEMIETWMKMLYHKNPQSLYSKFIVAAFIKANDHTLFVQVMKNLTASIRNYYFKAYLSEKAARLDVLNELSPICLSGTQYVSILLARAQNGIVLNQHAIRIIIENGNQIAIERNLAIVTQYVAQYADEETKKLFLLKHGSYQEESDSEEYLPLYDGKPRKRYIVEVDSDEENDEIKHKAKRNN